MENEKILNTENSSFIKSIEFYPKDGEIIVNMKKSQEDPTFTHSYLYQGFSKFEMQDIYDEYQKNAGHFGKLYWKYFPRGTGLKLR